MHLGSSHTRFQVLVDQREIIGCTWDDNDKHRQDLQEASHDSRTFGMRNVLCC